MTNTATAYMAQAIHLAQQGWYTARPNPRVGCVLVNKGHVVGTGAHLKAGAAHAEINALEQAGALAKGAEAYVTLEPCSHYGSTPPCADALIQAGITKVFIGHLDPNPLVAGQGKAKLEAAGIEVVTDVLAEQAQALNIGFIKRMLTGLPLVVVKLAMSLDGRTAMASGESKWITGTQARAEVQKLRAASCAIVTGVDSVIADSSRLTVRVPEITALPGFAQPKRVVVDSKLRLTLSSPILQQEGVTFIATSAEAIAAKTTKVSELEKLGARMLVVPQVGSYLCLRSLVQELGKAGCNQVLIEAGASLAGAFLQAGLVDELEVYMAPIILGNNAKGLFNLPNLTTLSEGIRLDLVSTQTIGLDFWFKFKPVY